MSVRIRSSCGAAQCAVIGVVIWGPNRQPRKPFTCRRKRRPRPSVVAVIQVQKQRAKTDTEAAQRPGSILPRQICSTKGLDVRGFS